MVRARTHSCSSRMRCSVRSPSAVLLEQSRAICDPYLAGAEPRATADQRSLRLPTNCTHAVQCVSLSVCVKLNRDPEMVQSDDRSPTVFVIDDDADVRASIAGLLKSVGLRVETFASALEFLSRGGSGVPGCLVLDFTLESMNGFDAQRVLADAGVQIPIIFISADGDIPTSARARTSGAVQFLTKPFDDQNLLDAIQEALNRDRAMRQR